MEPVNVPDAKPHNDTAQKPLNEFPAPEPPADDETSRVAGPIVGSGPSTHDTSPALVLNDSYQPTQNFFAKIINGMSWYGLELALSVVGLLVTTAVINYAIYATVNYAMGIDNPLAVRYLGEFSLWVASSMIVWLPLAVIFYLRTRAELERHPATNERMIHKLFVGFFLFNVVLAIAGTAFSVVYSLIRIMVGIDDQAGDTAVRTILPGILAAAVNTGLFWAYGRHQGLSRKLFAMIVAGAGVLVTIVLLAMSVSNVQGANRDEKAASDLSEIQSRISSYYSDKRSLPSSLNDLDGLKKEVKDRVSRYTYKKNSSTKYQLCATFVTDTQKQMGIEAGKSSSQSEYTVFESFTVHGTGEKCFKLTTSYSSLYEDYYNSNNNNSLFDSSNDSSSY